MRKDLFLGILATSLILVGIGAIFFSRLKPTEPTYSIFIAFQDIGTLQVGDSVSIQGVKKGKIQSFSLQDSLVLVKVSIPRSIRIPSNSLFQINNVGLFGEKKLSAHLTSSNIYLQDSDTIRGTNEPTLSTNKTVETVVNAVAILSISSKLDSVINLIQTQNEILKKIAPNSSR